MTAVKETVFVMEKGEYGFECELGTPYAPFKVYSLGASAKREQLYVGFLVTRDVDALERHDREMNGLELAIPTQFQKSWWARFKPGMHHEYCYNFFIHRIVVARLEREQLEKIAVECIDFVVKRVVGHASGVEGYWREHVDRVRALLSAKKLVKDLEVQIEKNYLKDFIDAPVHVTGDQLRQPNTLRCLKAEAEEAERKAAERKAAERKRGVKRGRNVAEAK